MDKEKSEYHQINTTFEFINHVYLMDELNLGDAFLLSIKTVFGRYLFWIQRVGSGFYGFSKVYDMNIILCSWIDRACIRNISNGSKWFSKICYYHNHFIYYPLSIFTICYLLRITILVRTTKRVKCLLLCWRGNARTQMNKQIKNF